MQRASEKIGQGIRSITVELHPNLDFHAAKNFVIHRCDGSRDNFS